MIFWVIQGETGANVLVGLQVPSEDMTEFNNQANKLGYEYAYEMDNEAYRLLMQWDEVSCIHRAATYQLSLLIYVAIVFSYRNMWQ